MSYRTWSWSRSPQLVQTRLACCRGGPPERALRSASRIPGLGLSGRSQHKKTEQMTNAVCAGSRHAGLPRASQGVGMNLLSGRPASGSHAARVPFAAWLEIAELQGFVLRAIPCGRGSRRVRRLTACSHTALPPSPNARTPTAAAALPASLMEITKPGHCTLHHGLLRGTSALPVAMESGYGFICTTESLLSCAPRRHERQRARSMFKHPCVKDVHGKGDP